MKYKRICIGYVGNGEEKTYWNIKQKQEHLTTLEIACLKHNVEQVKHRKHMIYYNIIEKDLCYHGVSLKNWIVWEQRPMRLYWDKRILFSKKGKWHIWVQ